MCGFSTAGNPNTHLTTPLNEIIFLAMSFIYLEEFFLPCHGELNYK
jgi:hypothetical protein